MNILLGIDVSSAQAGIDMAQVAREGFSFVLAKIGQGAGSDASNTYGPYINPAWPDQRDGASKAGMLRTGYWYVGNIEAPAEQAARCKAAMDDTSLGLALDWEATSGDWTNFLATLKAFRAAGLNVTMGYCPKWYGDVHGMADFNATGLALWSSKYPSTTPGFASVLYQNVPASYWDSYGGAAKVTLLQFADSARVAGLQVDTNAFLGPREELATLFGASARSPATASTPGETMMAINVGDWPAGQSVRRKLSCPVGKAFLYSSGWFSLAAGWADATNVTVWFMGTDQFGTPHYLHSEGPLTLRRDARRPFPIPDGTDQISVQYSSAYSLGWSVELTAP